MGPQSKADADRAEFAQKAKYFFGVVQDMKNKGRYRPRSKQRESLMRDPGEQEDIWAPSMGAGSVVLGDFRRSQA